MSGIAGIFYRRGHPVDQENIEAMVQSMDYRGPDGIHTWRDGTVALGHCMLHTTPEALYDSLPMESRDGNLVLTADARIDNRQDLSQVLGLSAAKDRPITDCDLIMAAYQKWGEDCPIHLIGAFAFAIWDKQAKKLFCARDHLGVKPLHYYDVGDVVAFSTEPKGILSLPFVDCIIDELRLLKSLNWVPRSQTDTVFKNIKKLNRACVMVSTRDSVKHRVYWKIEPSDEASDLSSEECVRRFKSYFVEAVKCRTRSANSVIGCDLSGGLDSSSVVCVANDIYKDLNSHRIIATSARFSKTPRCDEGYYINEVRNKTKVEAIDVDINAGGPLSVGREIYEYVDDGTTGAGNTFVKWMIWKQLGGTEASIVLTGTDGDTTVMSGKERLAELVSDGKFEDFENEFNMLSHNLSKESNDYSIQMGSYIEMDSVISKIVEPFIAKWALDYNVAKFYKGASYVLENNYMSAVELFRRYSKKMLFPMPVYRLYRRLVNKSSDNSSSAHPIVASRYSNRDEVRTAVKELSDLKGILPNVRSQQMKLWESGLHVGALENADFFAAPHGLEPRHPFMDIRLLRFCLGMPSDLSLRDGWTRYILREAMKGLLPESVRLRTAKANLESMFDFGLLEVDYEEAKRLASDLGEVERYVNVPYIHELLSQRKENNELDFTLLVSALTKVYWLHYLSDRLGKQPVIR